MAEPIRRQTRLSPRGLSPRLLPLQEALISTEKHLALSFTQSRDQVKVWETQDGSKQNPHKPKRTNKRLMSLTT